MGRLADARAATYESGTNPGEVRLNAQAGLEYVFAAAGVTDYGVRCPRRSPAGRAPSAR